MPARSRELKHRSMDDSSLRLGTALDHEVGSVTNATVQQLDLTYEATFAAPSFDLVQTGAQLLRSLHNSPHPRFRISPSDMHALGGTKISDVRCLISLFAGNGHIEVAADRLAMTFNNIRASADLAICKDCMTIVQEVVTQALRDTSILNASLKPTLFVRLDSENTTATACLSRIVGSRIEAGLGRLGNAIQYPRVSLEVGSTEERWYSSFSAYRNIEIESCFGATGYASYPETGYLQGIDHQIDHLKQLLSVFFSAMNLKVKNAPWQEEVTS